LFAIARHELSEALRSSRIQDEARRALAMQPIQLDDEAIDILNHAAYFRLPDTPRGRPKEAGSVVPHPVFPDSQGPATRRSRTRPTSAT